MDLNIVFDDVEDVATEWLVANDYKLEGTRKLTNLRYQLRKTFKNEKDKLPKKTRSFIEYLHTIEIEQKISAEKEKIKRMGMSKDELREYKDELVNAKVKKNEKTRKYNLLKFKSALRKTYPELEKEKVFRYFYGDFVPTLYEHNNVEQYEHDGWLTTTLENELDEDDFALKFQVATKKINADFDLQFNEFDYECILSEYYNHERKLFEDELYIDRAKSRALEIKNMPTRRTRDFFKPAEVWMKEMMNAGYYCGYPTEEYQKPTLDTDAWLFVGKKLMRALEYNRQNCKNYASVCSFVEMRINENGDNKNDIVFQGHNNMNKSTIQSIERRFRTNYIELGKHRDCKWFGVD